MSITNLGQIEKLQSSKNFNVFLLDPAGKIEWRVVNDDVMGGFSRSYLERSAQNNSWIFKGNLSLADNGGFTSIRSMKKDYDFINYKGIEVKVRGDGKKYGLLLNEDHHFTGFYYHHSFITRCDDWMVIQFDFDHFSTKYFGRPFDYKRKVDRSQIKEISLIISDKQEGEFQLEIAWIKLLPS